MEAYEGADWVRISDDVPVDEDALDAALETSRPTTTPARAARCPATALEQGDDEYDDGRGRPGPRARGLTRWPATRSPARGCRRLHGPVSGLRGDALVHGGARLRAGLVLWRSMPPGTGGRGSYGHRHPGQEEIYFVISGHGHVQGRRRRLRGRPETAVRMTGEEPYSVHNDTDADAELLLISTRLRRRRDRAARGLLAE